MPNEYSQSTSPDAGQGTTSTSNRPAGARPQRPDNSTRESARHASERIKHEAREVKQELRGQTEQALREMRQQGQAVLDERKQRTAEEISHIGRAAHKAADQLREDQDEYLACYVDAAGEQVDRAADYIRDRSVTEMADDARCLAREHPQIFYGALLVAGIAAARFVKASADNAQRQQVSGGQADLYDTDLEEGAYGEPVPGSYTPAGESRLADEPYNPALGSASLDPGGVPKPQSDPISHPDPTIPTESDSSQPEKQANKARGFGHTPGFEPEADASNEDDRLDPKQRF